MFAIQATLPVRAGLIVRRNWPLGEAQWHKLRHEVGTTHGRVFERDKCQISGWPDSAVSSRQRPAREWQRAGISFALFCL